MEGMGEALPPLPNNRMRLGRDYWRQELFDTIRADVPEDEYSDEMVWDLVDDLMGLAREHANLMRVARGEEPLGDDE